MKLHHTLAIGALLGAAVVTAALAQQSINSSQMATSLANVSGNNRLAIAPWAPSPTRCIIRSCSAMASW
jgi:hypothetical protein